MEFLFVIKAWLLNVNLREFSQVGFHSRKTHRMMESSGNDQAQVHIRSDSNDESFTQHEKPQIPNGKCL